MNVSSDIGDWQGNLKEALVRVRELSRELGLAVEFPTERAVRDWRDEGLLTRMGRRFTGRNVLEILRAKQLRDRDMPVALVKESLAGLSDAQLIEAILSGPAPASAAAINTDHAERTAILLAHAVLKQFETVQEGHLVGQYTHLPKEVRQAQAHLARLALQEPGDTPETFASVHDLFARCVRPLGEWAPRAIANNSQYAEMVLVDPDFLVPSDDCALLAEQGGHLEDLIETQLHGRLTTALGSLDPDERPAVYTRVRQFIAEHPLATREELREVRQDPRLSGEVAAFLEHVYVPAHADQAQAGMVARCGRCQAPLREDGRCRLITCRALHPVALPGESVPFADAFIARPEILKYWCDPAQEEVRLYRALRRVHGAAVQLYPREDACDVSLGDEIGIDVKDYRDPARLARKLNGSLGGLRLYSRTILAVASRRARNEAYLPRLREHLVPGLRQTLEVRSVDEVIDLLAQETHRD
ncbi:MerR family transcriptional regulator [Deinococcus planocerae]|uniref:restriction endonuclease-related protein n=1 Tax=Deinococcus planocerae TaxID=1737569 RepID=UPI000C7F3B19|nr:MerR family transcriptional regulator [Deinococcus planocerae]